MVTARRCTQSGEATNPRKPPEDGNAHKQAPDNFTGCCRPRPRHALHGDARCRQRVDRRRGVACNPPRLLGRARSLHPQLADQPLPASTVNALAAARRAESSGRRGRLRAGRTAPLRPQAPCHHRARCVSPGSRGPVASDDRRPGQRLSGPGRRAYSYQHAGPQARRGAGLMLRLGMMALGAAHMDRAGGFHVRLSAARSGRPAGLLGRSSDVTILS
jgi:hypothetical protein